MNEVVMHDLYRNFAKENGWLSRMIENFHLSDEEIIYLSWLDDKHMQMDKKVAGFLSRIETEGGADIALLETDEEKIAAVSQRLAVIDMKYEEAAFKQDASWFEKRLILWVNGCERLKSLRRKIRARTIHTKYPESMRVTEHDINTAREYPLENLVEVNRQKMMLCPFHQDKSPSFYVKNGWGYCFSCGKSCDAIGYLMEVKGLNFIDAVKGLVK